MLSDLPPSTAAREQRPLISLFGFLLLIMQTCSFEARLWPKISILEFCLILLSETKKELKRVHAVVFYGPGWARQDRVGVS